MVAQAPQTDVSPFPKPKPEPPLPVRLVYWHWFWHHNVLVGKSAVGGALST
jgi:hypothetical protein